MALSLVGGQPDSLSTMVIDDGYRRWKPSTSPDNPNSALEGTPSTEAFSTYAPKSAPEGTFSTKAFSTYALRRPLEPIEPIEFERRRPSALCDCTGIDNDIQIVWSIISCHPI